MDCENPSTGERIEYFLSLQSRERTEMYWTIQGIGSAILADSIHQLEIAISSSH